MEAFAIGIIGGTNGLGKWFASFFEREGYAVHVAGSKSGMPPEEMARICSVVIVSVPIGVTCEVIRTVGPLMPEGSLLMDFTSLKEAPVAAMLESTRAEVMGCHPLFGPSTESLRGHNIVLCPARVTKWASWPKECFSAAGARVTEMTPAQHDKLMAVVQSLNHFNTITMGLTMLDSGISRDELGNLSTPLFETKCAIVDRIFSGNSRLYAEIIVNNPHTLALLDAYEGHVRDIKRLVKEGDAEGIAALLQKNTVN